MEEVEVVDCEDIQLEEVHLEGTDEWWAFLVDWAQAIQVVDGDQEQKVLAENILGEKDKMALEGNEDTPPLVELKLAEVGGMLGAAGSQHKREA